METSLILRERASEPLVKHTVPLGHYQVVAFATHGLMAGEIPGFAEPALLLTPPPIRQTPTTTACWRRARSHN